MNKYLAAIYSLIISCLLLTGCNVKIIELEESTTINSDESTGAETSIEQTTIDDSWKTAQIETTVLPTSIIESNQITELSTDSITETSPPVEELTKIEEPVIENQTTVNINTVNFNAVVLDVQRRYIIVKPDINSDEFEISRKIIVYCSNSIIYNVGDDVTVHYDGNFGPDENDLPVITGETEKLNDNSNVPDFIANFNEIECEIIRVYTDGVLAKIITGNSDVEKDDKINVNIKEAISSLTKGQVLSIVYTGKIEFLEDDYPTIDAESFSIISSPQYIQGVVSAVNDKGIVLVFEEGTIDAELNSDIIIISAEVKDITEEQRVKIFFADNIEEEPFIIYEISDIEILE